MADCSDKCADDCSFDENEEKQKGVCSIKKEYIIEDVVRVSNEDSAKVNCKRKIESDTQPADDANNTGNSLPKKAKTHEKKEKQRGQNKARPPPFKLQRELSICPRIADQAVDEPERKCDNAKCTFMHDRSEYLKIKPADIGTECYLFNLSGKCPRGVACRMGSKHLTEDGLNIIDNEKLEEYKKKPLATRNQISKDLQTRIRKKCYDFSKAEKIVKTNHPPRKNNQATKPQESLETKEVPPEPATNGNGSVTESKSEDTSQEMEGPKINVCSDSLEETDKRIGPTEDYDLIKQRPAERKKIDWRNKLLLSPLTTVGNLPFRRICKEFGADITCGEMALAPKILKGAWEEWALVKRHECEDIFGVQLCGNNPGVLTRCAQLLDNEADIDYIDLNLGCPIDLIYSQGGGSGMLNRLNVLETVVKSVSQVLDIPLSVKTRTGVYIDKPIAHTLMPKFRDWGVSMITVHGRSREQRYTKLADWDYIERCAQAANPVSVFGNGDILSYDDYRRAREKYPSIDGITIGRGALIKPWIFTEIKERKLIDMSGSQRFDILKKYINYGLEHWGSDTKGVETTRRFLLEWISFLHRYVPIGILERPPQRINERPPYYRGRDDMETLMASTNCADWIKISEMLLGPVPDGFHFLPKHKANSWK